MAALDFLRRRHTVRVAHFDHGTEFAQVGRAVVEQYCSDHGLELCIGTAATEPLGGRSPEALWRDQRYQFLDLLDSPEPVVLAHTLTDSVETWLWSCCHGTPKLIPYARGRCIRPFMLNTRQSMLQWCRDRSVSWAEDPANEDRRYQRSRVRHDVLPAIRSVNPGIEGMIRRKLIDKFSTQC